MMLYNYTDYQLTTRDPITPFSKEIISPVTVLRSMSGKAYTYIKTPQKYRLSYELLILTEADRTNLINFYNVVVPNSFDLTDYNGDKWNVVFLDPILTLNEFKNYWRTTIKLEGTQYV